MHQKPACCHLLKCNTPCKILRLRQQQQQAQRLPLHLSQHREDLFVASSHSFLNTSFEHKHQIPILDWPKPDLCGLCCMLKVRVPTDLFKNEVMGKSADQT